MKIDNAPSQVVTNAKQAYAKQVPTEKKALEAPGIEKKNVFDTKQDAYIPSDKSLKKATYDKPVKKPDMETIAQAKEQSERVYGRMRDLVKQLLEEQTGKTKKTEKKENTVDTELSDILAAKTKQADAAASIAEGGEWSAENVSDKILEFAQKLAGDDKSKISELRDAIEKGFEAAKEAFGGELPEISKQTYKLVQEKLDKWEKGDSETPAAAAV